VKNCKIKYPKLLLLILTIIIAVVVFYEGMNYDPFHDFLISLGYFGTFLGGVFYAYSFTAAPATAVLLVLATEQNLILAVLIGGFGAVLSDFLIFNFIRHSLFDEINKLGQEKFIKGIASNVRRFLGYYYRCVFIVFAGFLIASPLPTEIGVTMIASMKDISTKEFMVIAYFLHSLGILVILTIGHLI